MNNRKIIILGIIIFIETIWLIANAITMDDQQKYIDGLRNQKGICDGQLEMVKQDYRRLFDELEKLRGEIDGN